MGLAVRKVILVISKFVFAGFWYYWLYNEKKDEDQIITLFRTEAMIEGLWDNKLLLDNVTFFRCPRKHRR